MITSNNGILAISKGCARCAGGRCKGHCKSISQSGLNRDYQYAGRVESTDEGSTGVSLVNKIS